MIGASLLIALAFVAAVGLAFVLGKALSNLRIQLSPGEWGYTVVLSFSLGAFLVAYLDGDGTLELVALIPAFLGIVWWVWRLWRRHPHSQLRARGA